MSKIISGNTLIILESSALIEQWKESLNKFLDIKEELPEYTCEHFCVIDGELVWYVVDPHVFVVGGGVMKAKDVFFDKMEKYYRSMIHVGMQPVVFKEAELEEPGIVGAAMLPMTKIK